MSHEEVRKHLENLRSEVSKLEDCDEDIKKRVDHLVNEVEYRLEHPDDTTRKESLHKSSLNFIGQFEASHSRVTAIVNQIMTVLSRIGV